MQRGSLHEDGGSTRKYMLSQYSPATVSQSPLAAARLLREAGIRTLFL